MANTLQDVMDTLIMPAALPVLREACVMPFLVRRDFDSSAARKNETIQVGGAPDMGVAGDFAGATSLTDLDIPSVSVTLGNWKYKAWKMSDKEMLESIRGGVLPPTVDSAIRSLANAVDLDLLNLYRDIPYNFGTAGMTPDAEEDLLGARQILQTNLAPLGDRRIVLGVAEEAKFLKLWSDVSKSGTTEALVRASLGTRFGFDMFSDQLIPTHTRGTLAAGGGGAIAIAANTLAGVTSITLDNGGAGTLTGTLVAGDLVQFAGGDESYTVTALATAAGNTVTFGIYPALTRGLTDGDVMTVTGSHTVNLAFHQDAFVLAMRPLANADEAQSESSTISVATDPVSGIPLRLETWRDPSSASRVWRFDILYGVKTLRPELAVRLLG